ncbi:MAG: MarR family transcriptional regulator [Erysipelotrichaceae bacterium]|nr:MarR family transcriptional regulator [Erysipelotrichaceae bacterium]
MYLADRNPADTATMIIRSQRLKKSVVSMSIDDLENRGMIESYYLEGDHRTKHLKVLDSAKPIIREAKKIQDQYYDLLTQGLEENEKDLLNTFLKKINRNISGYQI